MITATHTALTPQAYDGKPSNRTISTTNQNSVTLDQLSEIIACEVFLFAPVTAVTVLLGACVFGTLLKQNRTLTRRATELSTANQDLRAQVADLMTEGTELRDREARVGTHHIRKTERRHRRAKLAENKGASSDMGDFSVGLYVGVEEGIAYIQMSSKKFSV